MFPKVQHRVAECTELAILSLVSRHVPRDLVCPPTCIAFRSYVAPGTTVPEAPVDEDDDGMFAKDEVG
jgi:hypothetical protein